MADFDIFNPTISCVSSGVEGKLILIHSNERKLGKTLQATRFPSPYYLRFEAGINAINGVKFAALKSWSDFKRVNKRLTDPKTLDRALATYKTIIVDTTDVAIKWCEKYVCSTQGVERLNDGNSGYGLWKEYENEWFTEWNKLLNCGYCIIFIAHSEDRKMKNPVTGEEYVQLYPKGDKRTIDLIIDAADIIGYVKSNGYDENGKPEMSSIYFTPCPEFIAGSRFKYMPSEITPFTAEAVQKAIKEAVDKENAETDSESITFAEKVENESVKERSFDEIMDSLREIYKAAMKTNRDKTIEIVAHYLGEDGKISECTEKQIEQLIMIEDDLKDLVEGN